MRKTRAPLKHVQFPHCARMSESDSSRSHDVNVRLLPDLPEVARGVAQSFLSPCHGRRIPNSSVGARSRCNGAGGRGSEMRPGGGCSVRCEFDLESCLKSGEIKGKYFHFQPWSIQPCVITSSSSSQIAIAAPEESSLALTHTLSASGPRRYSTGYDSFP